VTGSSSTPSLCPRVRTRRGRRPPFVRPIRASGRVAASLGMGITRARPGPRQSAPVSAGAAPGQVSIGHALMSRALFVGLPTVWFGVPGGAVRQLAMIACCHESESIALPSAGIICRGLRRLHQSETRRRTDHRAPDFRGAVGTRLASQGRTSGRASSTKPSQCYESMRSASRATPPRFQPANLLLDAERYEDAIKMLTASPSDYAQGSLTSHRPGGR